MLRILAFIVVFELAAVCFAAVQEIVCRESTLLCALRKNALEKFTETERDFKSEKEVKEIVDKVLSNCKECQIMGRCDKALVDKYQKEFEEFAREVKQAAEENVEEDEYTNTQISYIIKSNGLKGKKLLDLNEKYYSSMKNVYKNHIKTKWGESIDCRYNVLNCEASKKIIQKWYSAEMKCTVKYATAAKQKEMIPSLNIFREDFTSRFTTCAMAEECEKKDLEEFRKEFKDMDEQMAACKKHTGRVVEIWKPFEEALASVDGKKKECASLRQVFKPIFIDSFQAFNDFKLEYWDQLIKCE